MCDFHNFSFFRQSQLPTCACYHSHVAYHVTCDLRRSSFELDVENVESSGNIPGQSHVSHPSAEVGDSIQCRFVFVRRRPPPGLTLSFQSSRVPGLSGTVATDGRFVLVRYA